ncbi:MAG: hypothetical protein KDK37_18370, partial [Leptospiraceae bacterium]|nr:hypothetical protein [Leptospiraceae bacterium]
MNRLYYSVFSVFLAGILYSGMVRPALAEAGSDEGKSAEEELFSKDELKPDSPLLDSAFEDQHPDSPTKPGEWEEPDIPDSFPELQILDELSQKKSLERMKKARDLYKTAAEIMQSAEPEFEEAKKKIDKLPATYEWQKQENQA